MEKIEFKEGQLVKSATVTIDGTEHEVKEAEYTGETPLSPFVLNAMQDNIEESGVVVSATTPTTGEKVWIRKGKNLHNSATDKNNTSLNVGTGLEQVHADRVSSDFIKVEPNTNYVVSQNASAMVLNIIEYAKDKSFIKYSAASSVKTTSQTCYIRFYSGNLTNVQFEQNTAITAYEEYIEPTVFIKNSNGIFEEFISKDNLINYSSSEQKIGTWIDGKPLYRKVFEVPETALSSTDNAVVNFNIDATYNVVNIHGFVKTQTSNYGCSLSFYGDIIIRQFGNTIQLVGRPEASAEGSITSGNIVIEYTKTTD